MKTEMHGGDGPMMTEAGTGLILPQAKECLEPPEAGRDKKGSHPRTSENA